MGFLVTYFVKGEKLEAVRTFTYKVGGPVQ